MEEEEVLELQGGCAHGRGGETGGAVAAGPGQQGEGSLTLPPHLFSISNSLFVPVSATVSSAVDSLPSSCW